MPEAGRDFEVGREQDEALSATGEKLHELSDLSLHFGLF
jgi:hypothetical protein